MLTLLQLLLPKVATQDRVAVLVDAIGEVLAGHADDSNRTDPSSLSTLVFLPIILAILVAFTNAVSKDMVIA